MTSDWKIYIEHLDIAHDLEFLLKDSTLKIIQGRRYGLVGRNGVGKTSLLRYISKSLPPEIAENITIFHVEQEVEPSERTALEEVVLADQERLDLLDECKKLEKDKIEDEEGNFEKIQDRLVDVYQRLTEINAYNAEARAGVILAGLQFTTEMQSCSVSSFSGGWRMRIALAQALFCRPDLLLLDEPTNHLDLFASIWLEQFLKEWKNTCLIVSHHESILEEVCTDIIHLYNHSLTYYKGNYTAYEKAFAIQKRVELKSWQKHIKEKKRHQKALGDTKGKSKKIAQRRRQIKSREKRESSRSLTKPLKEYKVSFFFPEAGKLPYPVINVKEVSFHYPGTAWIFQDVDFGLYQDDKIALIGRNGVGKSTLIKLLTGEYESTCGSIYVNRGLRIGYYHQHSPDQLNLDESAITYLCNKHSVRVEEVRKILGRYGLHGKNHENLMETLSGGQKARVCLADLSLSRPQILFLDEPTNHLDITSRRALVQALQDYNGCLIVVSHDKRLISSTCNKLWVVENQGIRIVEGRFEDYESEMVHQMDFDNK